MGLYKYRNLPLSSLLPLSNILWSAMIRTINFIVQKTYYKSRILTYLPAEQTEACRYLLHMTHSCMSVPKPLRLLP